ncbi:MAG: Ulp1 family isopeptidase [Candidatus Berkiella sp.]
MKKGPRSQKDKIIVVIDEDNDPRKEVVVLDKDFVDDENTEVSSVTGVPRESIAIDDLESAHNDVHVISLVEDAPEDLSDDEMPKQKAKSHLVTVDDLSDESSVVDQVKRQKQVTLTWQYITDLEVETEQPMGVQLKKVKRNSYILQSKIYEKHQDQKVILRKLISQIPEMGKAAAQRLLSPIQYIDDCAIDLYFNFLSEQNPSIANVFCHFAKLKEFDERLRKNDFTALRERCKLSRRILWPICDAEHWYLVIIDKISENQFNIFCLDSLNTETKAHFAKAENFLKALYHEREDGIIIKKKEHILVHEQDNSVDCGAAISFWGSRCAQNKMLPKSHSAKFVCDYSQFRVHMAGMLASNFANELERKKKNGQRLSQ